MTARTGEKCPASGIWKVEGFPTTTAPIAKGNIMPPLQWQSRYLEVDSVRLTTVEQE